MIAFMYNCRNKLIHKEGKQVSGCLAMGRGRGGVGGRGHSGARGDFWVTRYFMYLHCVECCMSTHLSGLVDCKQFPVCQVYVSFNKIVLKEHATLLD